MYIPPVARFDGQHHGSLLHSEGANTIALALSWFPSLATYARYREPSLQDAQRLAAFAHAERTRCIIGYKRGTFGPVRG
ncbi:NIPSNAP family protein [Xanthomonas codiaei]|uniref:NIPSNAP family protein n=1 Tax=Xanthomonas codiaei TaxID=56463 RepID=A0ABW9MQM2_9XANT|nr:NIPSNAP family protein [Xanthomonas codiaei]